jgi:flagellar L-ring protein precursor FlgH
VFEALIMNRITRLIIKLFSLALFAAMTTACQSIPPRDPAYAAVRPAAVPMAQQGNGSIYQQGFDVRLFEDQLARRVGDILTVQLSEATSASKDAETNLSKTNSNSVTNPTLFGATPQFNTPGVLPLTSNSNNNLSFGLDSDHSFDGSGSSSQSNSLSGSITVSVVEVLPNGNLIIRGEKVLQLNQGHEYVRLSGIVRKADIRPDNTVLSTQVADAQIAYSGTGAVQDTNVVGWLARFFVSALMPF